MHPRAGHRESVLIPFLFCSVERRNTSLSRIYLRKQQRNDDALENISDVQILVTLLDRDRVAAVAMVVLAVTTAAAMFVPRFH